MTDAWIELAKDGMAPQPGTEALLCDNPSQTTGCEIVDKVWYRGSPAVSIQATSFAYAGDMFVQDDGVSVLSDHNPVLVEFAWGVSEKWRVSQTFGGEFGRWFNDLEELGRLGEGGAEVREITLRGGSRVDGVAFTLAEGRTLEHGGQGGTASSMPLTDGEVLIGATLCRGERNGQSRIFFVEMRTSEGKSVSAGTKTGDCVERNAEEGWAIAGLLGRSGDEVDMLGFVYSRT